MPEAQVKMNVRRAGEKASIIDVQGGSPRSPRTS